MLVLSRKLGETITIGDRVEVTVARLFRNRVVLRIAAPENVSIDRSEVWARKHTASHSRSSPT
jgi:carbon storage regulator